VEVSSRKLCYMVSSFHFWIFEWGKYSMEQRELAISNWKDESTEEMYRLLQELSSDFPIATNRIPKNWEFTLLKYTLHTAVFAAEAEDYELIEQTLQFWDKLLQNPQNSFSYGKDGWMMLDADYCPIHKGLSKQYNTNYRLLTEKAVELGFQKLSHSYLTEAWNLIQTAGLIPHIRNYGNIVLHQQFVHDPVYLSGNSNLLQGLIHTDWSTDPLYYAESLVHESAHSLFNYYYQLFQIEVDNTLYWSPWRKSNRPVFGVLHGAWAFTYVYHFYDQLSKQENPSVSKEQIKLYKARSQFEAERLQTIGSTLKKILQKENNPVLTELFQKLDHDNRLFFVGD
jgi:hypothetical protein